MNYKIEFRSKASKFLKKQNIEQQKRILKAIYKIPNGDIIRLVGCEGLYRLRVGDVRIIYSLYSDKIIVFNIGNRGDIYKYL